jgi:hypothetical protein
MVVLMILLLYFNLYYEYCFRDALITVSKIKICSCLNCFLRYYYYTNTSTSKQEDETIVI